MAKKSVSEKIDTAVKIVEFVLDVVKTIRDKKDNHFKKEEGKNQVNEEPTLREEYHEINQPLEQIEDEH
ncbi:MAG: hypothetical protein ACK5B9_00845 [Flavobacteriia bacterium]|jgi:uncharacterized spore protein YtfJ